jgi:hypothetical protein
MSIYLFFYILDFLHIFVYGYDVKDAENDQGKTVLTSIHNQVILIHNYNMKVRLRNAALIYWSENFFRPATYILFPGSECDMVKSFAAQAKIVRSIS